LNIATNGLPYMGQTLQIVKIHWLPIKQRIEFKILLTFADLLTKYAPPKTLRSSSQQFLNVPKRQSLMERELSRSLYHIYGNL
jgi:hypothetical protein